MNYNLKGHSQKLEKCHDIMPRSNTAQLTLSRNGIKVILSISLSLDSLCTTLFWAQAFSVVSSEFPGRAKRFRRKSKQTIWRCLDIEHAAPLGCHMILATWIFFLRIFFFANSAYQQLPGLEDSDITLTLKKGWRVISRFKILRLKPIF